MNEHVYVVFAFLCTVEFKERFLCVKLEIGVICLLICDQISQ